MPSPSRARPVELQFQNVAAASASTALTFRGFTPHASLLAADVRSLAQVYAFSDSIAADGVGCIGVNLPAFNVRYYAGTALADLVETEIRSGNGSES